MNQKSLKSVPLARLTGHQLVRGQAGGLCALARDCNMPREIWKPVFGYEDCYAVSDKGRIKRTVGRTAGRLRKIGTLGAYLGVHLCKNGKLKPHLAHRLVYEAFVGRIAVGLEINHLDGNTYNNRVTNLEAVTHADNQKHAALTGLMPRGEDNKNSALTESDVRKIRKKLNSPNLERGFMERIGAEFGVSDSAISHIKVGRTWAWLK